MTSLSHSQNRAVREVVEKAERKESVMKKRDWLKGKLAQGQCQEPAIA